MKQGFFSFFFLVLILIIFFQSVGAREAETASDWYNKGLSLSNNGKYEEALQAFYTARSMDPRFFDEELGISYPIGWVLAKLGRYEEALKEFDKALDVHPTMVNDYALYYNKGYVLAKVGRYEEALKAIDKGLILAPFNIHLSYNKGWVLNKLGRYQEAVYAYDRSLWGGGMYLTPLGSYQNVANTYDKAFIIHQGIEQVQQNQEPLKNEPDNERVGVTEQINESMVSDWFEKGIDLVDQKRWNDALMALNKAYELEPSKSEILLYKGICLNYLGKYNEALIIFNKTTEYFNYRTNSEGYQSAWYNKGRMLAYLGSYEYALEAFNKVLTLNPDNYITWYNKGWVLAKLGRYDDAVVAYDRYLALSHRSIMDDAWSILDPLGTYHEATEPYAKVAAVDSQENITPEISSNEIIYQTDFSNDPGWHTSCPRNYYWDKNQNAYHFKSDINGGYAEYIVPYQGGSFTLKYDITVVHADPGSRVRVGLTEYNKTYAERNMITSGLNSWGPDYYWPKSGDKLLAIYAINDQKGLTEWYKQVNGYMKNEVPHFGEGKVYHVTLSLDEDANDLMIQITDNFHPPSHYDYSTIKNKAGKFKGMNRILLVAEQGSNAYIEGYIDNIEFSVPRAPLTVKPTPSLFFPQNISSEMSQSQSATEKPTPLITTMESSPTAKSPIASISVITAILITGLIYWRENKRR